MHKELKDVLVDGVKNIYQIYQIEEFKDHFKKTIHIISTLNAGQ